jgi:integrase
MGIITLISQYPSCQRWIEAMGPMSTKTAYTFHLWRFCKFYNTDPDRLIKINSKDLTEMIINYVLAIKKAAKNSAGKPKRRERSVNSVKQYTKGITSFFDEHDLSLPWKKISRYYPEDVRNVYRSYTKDEISKLLSLADLRDRCIILLMASSGIRVGAIPDLTLKSLKKLDEGLGLLTVYEESKRSRYVTLVTPECMSSIEQYIELRRSRGEKLTENSYLIRDKYAIYSKRINSPLTLREHTINAQMRQLIRKAGLPFEELQPDHAARKFFNTALVNSEVDPIFKKLLMGHDMKLDRFYYDQESEHSRKQIILQYLKAVDTLTISDEFRLRKQIAEHEERLKNVPNVEQLQDQLTNRMIEQDSIKRSLEKLQEERELHEQYVIKRELEMKNMREQIRSLRRFIDDINKRFATLDINDNIAWLNGYRIPSRS